MVPLHPCLPPERRKCHLLRTTSQKTSPETNKAIRESEMSLASNVAAELSCLGRQEGRRAALGQSDRNRGQAAILVVPMLEMMGRACSGRGWCDR